jgi:hypothetical protein
MSCLSLERIYDYLEGELSARERKSFDRHIDACPRCRRALDARRTIAEAAGSLPPLEVPADFVRAVMADLPSPGAAVPVEERAPRRRPSRLALALTGASALGAIGVATLLIAGNGIPGIFIGVGRSLQTTSLSVSPDIFKAARIITLLRRLASDLLAWLLEIFDIAASFIDSDVRIAIVGIVFVAMMAGGLLYARKLILERNHDQS